MANQIIHIRAYLVTASSLGPGLDPVHVTLVKAGSTLSDPALYRPKVQLLSQRRKKANISMSYIFHTMNFLCVTHNQWDSLETPTLIPFSLTISVNFSLAYISHHFSIRGRESSLCRTQPLMTLWHVSGRRRGWSHGWHHGHLWWTQVRQLRPHNGHKAPINTWQCSFSGPPLVFPSCTVALTLDTASCSWWSTLLTLYTTVAVILVVISLLG